MADRVLCPECQVPMERDGAQLVCPWCFAARELRLVETPAPSSSGTPLHLASQQALAPSSGHGSKERPLQAA